MTSVKDIRGSLPEIIRNDAKLYEGDLVHYFRVVFDQAKNLHHPYHNFRHMLHVVWLCYQACQFYQQALTSEQMRILLIAAIMHDVNHTGRPGPDATNIALAIEALERYILPQDRPLLSAISALIRTTDFPYKVPSDELWLEAQILRDADLSQALSVAWIQQVVFGLAAEWGKNPLDVLKMQGPFLSSLKFHTEWAKSTFPKNIIEEKIAEARGLQEILETRPAAAA